MPAKILLCTCDHAGQDKLHGPGRRVFNPAKGAWRCSVCQRQIVATDGKKK